MAANLLLVVGGAVLALCAAEAGVRIAGLGSDQFLRPDPVLGVRFIPSKTGLSQGACYRADVTISQDGWRSPDLPETRDRDVYRILLLGDSFMAGLQVGDAEAFPRLLEERLVSAVPGRRVEVVNFGVPSWGTDQEYLALREFGLALAPDLVLLAFYAQNDVSDNDPLIRSSSSTYPKPTFDLRDGTLVEVPFVDTTPGLIALGRRAAAPFRVYPMTRDALMGIPAVHRLLFALGIVGVVPPPATTPEPAGATIWRWPDRWSRQLGVFEKPEFVYADWQRAWTITEGLIERMQSVTEAAGAEFLMMEVASPIEVMPASILDRLIDRDEVDVDAPSVRLAAMGAREGFDVVSLLPGFRDRIGGSADAFDALFLPCDGHWTVEGHRLAARIAAQAIGARLAALRP